MLLFSFFLYLIEHSTNLLTMCYYASYLFRPLLLLTICLLASMSSHAQNSLKYIENNAVASLPYLPTNANITIYVFQKIDKNGRLEAFTSEHADELMLYFLSKENVWACQAHAVDKSVKIITPADPAVVQLLHHKALANELQQMGYRVFSYRTTQEKLLFEMNKPSQTNQPYLHEPEKPLLTQIKECDTCGAVKISQDLFEKYKDTDYGSAQINFDDDSSNSLDEPTDATKTTEK